MEDARSAEPGDQRCQQAAADSPTLDGGSDGDGFKLGLRREETGNDEAEDFSGAGVTGNQGEARTGRIGKEQVLELPAGPMRGLIEKLNHAQKVVEIGNGKGSNLDGRSVETHGLREPAVAVS